MTLEEKVDALAELVRQVLAKLDMPAPVRSDKLLGPGPTFVNGAYIRLAEPIKADWQPSVTDVVATGPNNYGADPSNGDGSVPRRSPGGYPIVYAPGFFGFRGKASIVYAGQLFDTDAALEAYKARIASPSQVQGTSGTFGPK